MKRRSNATDLSDAEWEIPEPLIPAPLPNGRPAKWQRRWYQWLYDGPFCIAYIPLYKDIF